MAAEIFLIPHSFLEPGYSLSRGGVYDCPQPMRPVASVTATTARGRQRDTIWLWGQLTEATQLPSGFFSEACPWRLAPMLRVATRIDPHREMSGALAPADLPDDSTNLPASLNSHRIRSPTLSWGLQLMPQEAEMSPPIHAKSCPNCRFRIIINDCHCFKLLVFGAVCCIAVRNWCAREDGESLSSTVCEAYLHLLKVMRILQNHLLSQITGFLSLAVKTILINTD